MDISIGARAARWVGLQINLLQKCWAGDITADHLSWFLGLAKEELDVLMLAAAERPSPILKCIYTEGVVEFAKLIDFHNRRL